MRCSCEIPSENLGDSRRRVPNFLHGEISLENVMEVGDGQPSLCRIELACVFAESGDRWVSIEMLTSKRVLISAHLATIKAPLEDFNVPLHELEQLIRRFPDHEVILGNDANTKVFNFEDGWHVGPCTKPARLTSKEQERASSLTEFLTRIGLVLANTWSR